ncbi:MAG: AAA family ATPase [Candidatus Thorarchaeota archaeon SMTZ1-45]|nr:MAG: hypothetical protein AM325_16835 [Candidatus Thorarchaeota archaeon SMTZ1-45]
MSNQQVDTESKPDPMPVITELVGEPTEGKTHIALLFSNPALADLTETGESVEIVKKLYPEDWSDRYFRCKTFQDVRNALNQAYKDGRKTLIIETGAHLRLIAGAEALEDLQKNKPERKNLHPTEWRYVNEEVAKFLSKSKEEYKMNIVFTAQMDDEWVNKEKTGKRKNESYPKMDHIADIRIFLKIKEVEIDKVMTYRRVGTVFKNRLDDKLSPDFVKQIIFERDNSPSELKTFKQILSITKVDEERWVM